MSTGRTVFLIVLAGTLLRLVLAAVTGLGTDESYMVGNARELALGYFDHPPLHVWIVWAAERLFGSEAPVFVRLPFIVLFAGSTWLMFRLTARLFGARAGLWAAIAFNLAPVFSLADGSWVLPDGPSIFFLLAAANVAARVLFDEATPGKLLLWWLAAGLLVGLALLSKFNAAFFPLAVFAFLVTVPAARRHLAMPGPWLAAIVALAVLSPAIVWNMQHGWVGIAFQAGRAAGAGLRFDWLATDAGGELAYLTPWLAVPFALSLASALVRGRRDPAGWLMALLAIGPIVCFTAIALWSHGLPHWTMPGWLFAIPLFGRDAAALAERRSAFARGYMAAVGIVFAALLAVFAVQATTGVLIPATLVAERPGLDPTADLVDWTDLDAALTERGLLSAAGTVVAVPHWTIAGKVSYALGPGVPVLCISDDPRQFAFRYDQRQWAGRDVIVVVPRSQPALWAVAATYFDGFEPLAPVNIDRNGLTVLTLDLRLGRNLHFPPR